MFLLLILLAVQADPAGETAELIRKLGSDIPEERDRATVRLKKIGPPAREALQEVVRTGEGESRERAREILAEFERVARIQALRPSERRITVRLHEAPLAEALAQLLAPFGMTDLEIAEELAGRKITLSLENSAFWESLDRLEEAANLHVDPSGWISSGTRTKSEWSGSGNLRVSTGSWGSRGSSNAPIQDFLPLHAWLPPGVWACAAEVENLAATDETGKKIPAEWHGRLESIRVHRRPSSVDLGGVGFLRGDLKGVKTVTVRATLKIGIPKDVERRVMDPVPGRVAILGGSVTIDKLLKNERDVWDLSVDATGGDEPFTVLLSAEEENGRWLGDLQTVTLQAGSSVGCYRAVNLLPGIPVRCVVYRALGQDILETPFTLQVSARGR